MEIFPHLALLIAKFQRTQWHWLHYFCYLNLCSQNIAIVFFLSRANSSGMQISNDEFCIHQLFIWKWTIKPFDVYDGCARRPNQNHKPPFCTTIVEQIKPFSWHTDGEKKCSDIKNANNNNAAPVLIRPRRISKQECACIKHKRIVENISIFRLSHLMLIQTIFGNENTHS